MINCRRAIFQGAIAVTLTFLLSAPLASDQAQSSDNSFAITGVNVLPMDENRVLQNQTVIVINGTIEVIGDSASTAVPAEIRIIEGNGQYLMPGLADLHVHILHEDDFVNYLAWGVTTVMHLGGSGISGSDVLRHRNEIAAGKTLGPNIYTTNRIFDGDPRLNGASIELTDPDTAREEVRKLKADGFDFIKIYNNLAQPEFEATVDEAQKAGLSVIGHIPRKFDTLIALSGGQNAIAHTEELFFSYFEGPRSTDDDMSGTYEPDMARLEPLIDVMVTNDVAVMPDLAFTFTDLIMWDDLEIIWNDSDFPYLHPATASMWESGNINRRSNIENFVIREQWKYELMLELTRQFQQAGILQVIGTDAAIPGLYPGKAAHRELTELVKAGLSNYDAMAIGTRNAGEFARRYIDRDVRFGQVLPGYRADLVLVDGNPLEDVRHARNVNGLSVNGRYLSRAQIDARREILKTRYDFLRGANNRVDAALEKAGGEKTIQQMIDANPGDTEFLSSIEARINETGYSAAFANDLDRSEEILRLNTRLFPKSANTWDSLAEVTLYRGNREAALELYRKALQADPDFENAAEQIKKILSDSDK
jgi:tetratricopeptide (TPR) repeat protein